VSCIHWGGWTFGGISKLGEIICTTGEIPQVDLFPHPGRQPFLDQYWLGEVLYYLTIALAVINW